MKCPESLRHTLVMMVHSKQEVIPNLSVVIYLVVKLLLMVPI